MNLCSRNSLTAIMVAGLVVLGANAFAAPPAAVSPGAADRIATIRGDCPAFSWGEVDGASFYELVAYQLPQAVELASDVDVSQYARVLLQEVPRGASSWTPTVESCLAQGASYVWFVRAVFDEEGTLETGEWSQGLFFAVAAAPSVEQVEQAIDVLRRYVEQGGGSAGDLAARPSDVREAPASGLPGRTALEPLRAKALPGSAAIKGEMPDLTGQTYGVYGVTNSATSGSYGVVGETTNSSQGVGVAGFQPGYSDADLGGYWKPGGIFGGRNGVVGITKANTGYAVVGLDKSSAGGWAGVFLSDNGNGVYVSVPGAGLNVAGGTKNAVVRSDAGSLLMYSEESTEVWFSDYGFGQLRDGKATITFDPIFAQTVNLTEPYHVFLQAYADAEMFVSNRSADGFEVHARQGAANAEFSYRIIALRLGYEGARMEPAPWADNDPNLYPEKANQAVRAPLVGEK